MSFCIRPSYNNIKSKEPTIQPTDESVNTNQDGTKKQDIKLQQNKDTTGSSYSIKVTDKLSIDQY
jgi:hypothetical protein